MSKNDFSKGQNIIKHCEKSGCEVRRGKGDHVVVYSPDGKERMVIPDRPIGYGLECKITKWMRTVGILVFIGFVLYVNNAGFRHFVNQLLGV